MNYYPPPIQEEKTLIQVEKIRGGTQTKVAWIKVIGGTLGCLSAVLVAVFGCLSTVLPVLMASPENNPSPPAIPRQVVTVPNLHTTYTGLISDAIQSFPMSLTNLTQDSDGNFQASGIVASCYVSFSGTVSPDGHMTFTGSPLVPSDACAITVQFTGNVNHDGSNPRGQWVNGIGASGEWYLS